jgi:hypothetical protein
MLAVSIMLGILLVVIVFGMLSDNDYFKELGDKLRGNEGED